MRSGEMKEATGSGEMKRWRSDEGERDLMMEIGREE